MSEPYGHDSSSQSRIDELLAEYPRRVDNGEDVDRDAPFLRERY